LTNVSSKPRRRFLVRKRHSDTCTVREFARHEQGAPRRTERAFADGQIAVDRVDDGFAATRARRNRLLKAANERQHGAVLFYSGEGAEALSRPDLAPRLTLDY